MKTTTLVIYFILINLSHVLLNLNIIQWSPFAFPKVMLLWQCYLYMESINFFKYLSIKYLCLELYLWGHASSWSLWILSLPPLVLVNCPENMGRGDTSALVVFKWQDVRTWENTKGRIWKIYHYNLNKKIGDLAWGCCTGLITETRLHLFILLFYYIQLGRQ